MTQHPMVKAYIKAFAQNGGKAWKSKFNPFRLDQKITFGYRSFYFRIYSAGTVASWDTPAIPAGVTNCSDVVMIQTPDFSQWLACDADAKAEYEAFRAVVAKTFAVCTW